jgi:hypothetical protein
LGGLAQEEAMSEEKKYSTKELIENLSNALKNGYEELGETDIGDLLLMCVRPTTLAEDEAWACSMCGATYLEHQVGAHDHLFNGTLRL